MSVSARNQRVVRITLLAAIGMLGFFYFRGGVAAGGHPVTPDALAATSPAVVLGERREEPVELTALCTTLFEVLDGKGRTPLPDARVQLASTQREFSSTLHDAHGQTALLAAGSYILMATAAGHRVEVQEVQIDDSVQETKVVVYLKPAESIPSVLVDEEGQPMKETTISLFGFDERILAQSMYLSTTTDGRGRFDSGFIGPGDYLVNISWSVGAEYVVVRGVVTLTGQAGPALLVVDE